MTLYSETEGMFKIVLETGHLLTDRNTPKCIADQITNARYSRYDGFQVHWWAKAFDAQIIANQINGAKVVRQVGS